LDDGVLLGSTVGMADGGVDGSFDGCFVGAALGPSVGSFDGDEEGSFDGGSDGAVLGSPVGSMDGVNEGAGLGKEVVEVGSGLSNGGQSKGIADCGILVQPGYGPLTIWGLLGSSLGIRICVGVWLDGVHVLRREVG
jgi:hypothetical protein